MINSNIKKLKYTELNDKKILFRIYEIWVNNLLQKGVIFFALTINLCELCEDGSRKMFIHDIDSTWKEIHYMLENFSTISFIDCIYGSVEMGKEGIPRLNFVIGFRNHFDCLKFLISEISNLLFFSSRNDFNLRFLKNFLDIMQFIKYLSKDFEYSKRKREYALQYLALYSIINKKAHNIMADHVVDTAPHIHATPI